MRFLNPRHALGAVLALLLMLCVGMAYAGTATLTWTNPTTRTDGSAVAVAKNRIYRAPTCTSVFVLLRETTGPVTTYVDSNVPAGTYCWAVTALDSAGLESGYATVLHVIPAAPPSPPTGLTVTAVVAGLNMSPAYRINADGTRGSVVLGFVPTGTSCTGSPVYSYRGVSYARVDPTQVRWWGTSPTPNVAAPCRAG